MSRRPYPRRAVPERTGTCNWCRQPIEWAHEPSGRWVPLDPDPSVHGDYALLPDQRCLKLSDHSVTCDSEHRRTDHRQTCGTRKAPAE